MVSRKRRPGFKKGAAATSLGWDLHNGCMPMPGESPVIRAMYLWIWEAARKGGRYLRIFGGSWSTMIFKNTTGRHNILHYVKMLNM